MQVTNFQWMIALFFSSALHMGAIIAAVWNETNEATGTAVTEMTSNPPIEIGVATIGGALTAQALPASDMFPASEMLHIEPASALNPAEVSLVLSAMNFSKAAAKPLKPAIARQPEAQANVTEQDTSLIHRIPKTAPLASIDPTVHAPQAEMANPPAAVSQDFGRIETIQAAANPDAMQQSVLMQKPELSLNNSAYKAIKQPAKAVRADDKTVKHDVMEWIDATQPEVSTQAPKLKRTDDSSSKKPLSNTAVESLAQTDPTDEISVARAGSSAAADDFEFKATRASYLRSVYKQIVRHKRYPQSARHDRATGKVLVRFSILSEGNLHEPIVVKSSGDDRLDQAAIDILLKASPFAPIPKSMKVSELSIKLPISFSLVH